MAKTLGLNVLVTYIYLPNIFIIYLIIFVFYIANEPIIFIVAKMINLLYRHFFSIDAMEDTAYVYSKVRNEFTESYKNRSKLSGYLSACMSLISQFTSRKV